MFGSSYANYLDMSFWLGSWYEHPLQVYASYNILQYLCDFIHVLIFCNCLKMPKKSQINESSDKVTKVFPIVLTVEPRIVDKMEQVVKKN